MSKSYFSLPLWRAKDQCNQISVSLALRIFIIVFTSICRTTASDPSGNRIVVDNPLPKCVPIVSALCHNVGYNFTIEKPPLRDEPTSGEIATDLAYWQSIEKSGCSRYLRQFVCAAYNPMCDPSQAHIGAVGPCRRICEHVRRRCEALIQTFIPTGWPTRLDCNQFPVTNAPNSLCMDINIADEVNESLIQIPPPYQPVQEVAKTTAIASRPSEVSRNLCAQMPKPENFVYINRSERCALRCDEDMLFGAEQKSIAQIWTLILSGVCFVISMFTVLSIFISIKHNRFRYPERPVVFMAGCYCALSGAYLIRFAVGREAVSCTEDPATHQTHLTLEGLENVWCSVVFLISYFFGLAGSIWWCLMTVSLALATAWQKTHDSVKHYASYFYMIGLGVPAVLTIIVLVFRWVDADELLGMCYVGSHNSTALLYLVIVPHAVTLIIGSVFLIIGCSAQIRAKQKFFVARDYGSKSVALVSQNQNQHANAKAEKDQLETSMVKIGLYSVIGFILPSTCVMACNIYEYVNSVEWLSGHARPAIEIFLLRIFMLFTMGITTVMFVWSKKTLNAWKQCVLRMCCQINRYDKSVRQAVVCVGPGSGSGSGSGDWLYAAQPVEDPLGHRVPSSSGGGGASCSAASRYDYELVQQDDKTRETGTSYVMSSNYGLNVHDSVPHQVGVHTMPHLPSAGLSAGVAVGIAVTNTINHGNYANTNQTVRSRQIASYVPTEYVNSHMSPAMNVDARLEPSSHIYAQYYTGYPSEQYNTQYHLNAPQNLFMGQRGETHEMGIISAQVSAQIPAQGNYRLNVGGTVDWAPQVAMSNVVAPPPSLVNAQVGAKTSGYYAQQSTAMQAPATTAAATSDSRWQGHQAHAFSAYAAKGETVF